MWEPVTGDTVVTDVGVACVADGVTGRVVSAVGVLDVVTGGGVASVAVAVDIILTKRP